MPNARINGFNVHYDIAGSGHPVIFVHGHGLDSRFWQGQVQPISRLYTVITYDVRGHGKSDAPITGYSRPYYAEELFGLVQHLEITKPSVVGHSTGAGVAIEYALGHPTRVSSLTLVDSGLEGFSYGEAMADTVVKQRILIRTEGTSEKFLRAALISPLYNGVRQDQQKLALVRTMLSGWSGAQWKDTATYPESDRSHLERLGELRLPVLVATGENDLEMFHDVAAALTQGITVVRKATVPGAGHMAPLEQPESFNDILLDFLGGAVGKALI